MARVLVVDDDPNILKLAEKVLSHANYDVFVAPGAMQAMEYLNSTAFDAVISDANMPECSGFELVQNIKNNKRFENLAIAMLTGLREKKDIERAIRLGVDDYIVKPIDPLLFLQKVEALFAKKPPEKRSSVQLLGSSPFAAAHLSYKIRLTAVSEIELEAISTNPVEVGSMINVSGTIFDEWRPPTPPLRVLSCQPSKDSTQWDLRLSYFGASEAFMQKLRGWIYTHTTKTKSVS